MRRVRREVIAGALGGLLLLAGAQAVRRAVAAQRDEQITGLERARVAVHARAAQRRVADEAACRQQRVRQA